MSRPFRNLLALCLTASSFGLYGCGTIYTPMYSNQNTHFKPPEAVKKDGTKEKSAAELMAETDKATAAAAANPLTVPADAGGLPAAPPPDGGAIPGLGTPPPATPPATPPPAQ